MERFIEWMAERMSTESPDSRRGFLKWVGAAGVALATTLFAAPSAFATKKKAAKKKATRKRAKGRVRNCCEYVCDRDGQTVSIRTSQLEGPCEESLEELGRCTDCVLQSETISEPGNSNCQRDVRGCVGGARRKKAAKKKASKKKASKKKAKRKKATKKKATKKKAKKKATKKKATKKKAKRKKKAAKKKA